MIRKIKIENLLPKVFDDQRDSEAIKRSHVWLETLTFEKPESYLVYAESGTGKSSLCSFLYGARHDYFGRILFDDVDVRGFDPDKWSQIRCTSIAYLPQQLSLFPELTAMENIMIKNRLTDIYTEADIHHMLQRLSIDDKANTPAAILSIGQQQRVAIIRALCQPFDFLLLDEPVSHLDARNNSIVADLIAEHVNRNNASLIATSVGNHISIDPNKILRL